VTDHALFVANLNPDGKHVLHRFPAYEQCNLDDTDKLVYLDQGEVNEMAGTGKARRCEICFPLVEV
jgi:hypothetical protein